MGLINVKCVGCGKWIQGVEYAQKIKGLPFKKRIGKFKVDFAAQLLGVKIRGEWFCGKECTLLKEEKS